MTTGPLPVRPDDGRGPAAGSRWIVSECSGRWAIGLRREAGPAGIRLYETRSLADGWAMLQQYASSFLVAELTHANALSLVERVSELERTCPLARVAVVAEPSLAGYEWMAREAGVVWFAMSPRALRPIAALAARHMQLAPSPPGGLVEQIWSSLPWGWPVRDG